MNNNTKNMLISLLAVSALCVSCKDKALTPETPGGGGTGEGKTFLPDWEEGYMDIHHIATGKGDCVFVVMPDGTTMLQDAGDVGDAYGSAVFRTGTRPSGSGFPTTSTISRRSFRHPE